jgi:hypothetical protein
MAIDDNSGEHPTPITKYGVISIISASALDRHIEVRLRPHTLSAAAVIFPTYVSRLRSLGSTSGNLHRLQSLFEPSVPDCG